jgi:hypothetical protein
MLNPFWNEITSAKSVNVVAISKEEILRKSHRGLSIYSHVLRLYYPKEVVLSLRGRDCLPTRNPFNQDRPTLHVFIKDNLAQHEDLEGKIPAGDCFDFAMFHYLKHGADLLNTLNQDMHLRIGVKYPFYHGKMKTIIQHTETTIPQFSFFKAPISNIIPAGNVTILDVYRFLKNDFVKETHQLRSITDPSKARAFKAANLNYVTFSGSFSKRNDKHLIAHSGLMCLDFDHLPNSAEIKQILLKDPYFETEMLFVSPSGDGLKWVIAIDTDRAPHRDYFMAVSNYLEKIYSLKPDPSGKDISRACFLPHDPEAYLNPKYL